MVVALIAHTGFSQNKNPVIGKWRWSSSSCESPNFIFSDSKITQILDGDGVPTTFIFDKVKYKVSEKNIEVDFGKPHGIGKTKDKDKVSFKIVDDNHLVMDRKTKSLNDLYRCL